jgi:hypothetical protein
MNAFNKFVVGAAMDINGPPGLTHPLFVENYAWVDQCLKEFYHSYALTADNYDEYEAAGLMTENWSWIDDILREKYSYILRSGLLCPAPLGWADYRQKFEHHSLEEDDDTQESFLGKRKRAESDISDHEDEVLRAIIRLRCQSPIHSSEYLYLRKEDFDVSSIESDRCNADDDCSSEVSTLLDEELDGYDFDEEFDEELYGYNFDSWESQLARIK